MANRNGSYPPSVHPGIPKLTPAPKGWRQEPLKPHLKEVLRPVTMDDETLYQLVTVKRSRGGAVERGWQKGKDIKVKTQSRVQSGDFLISKRQIVHGACALVPEDLDGAIVSNEYAILNTNNGLDPSFLNYLAATLYFQQTCFHSSIGVHVEKMIFKLDWWYKWKFNLPPLPEQTKIASILSTWDRAIETTEKLIENSRQQKQALMQRLLTGKKRLPGFKGEWEYRRIKELVQIVYGKSSNGKQNESGKYPIIGTGGVVGYTNDYLNKGPSIVIGRKGTIDNPLYVEVPFWAIDTTFFCVARSGCNLKWLYYLLQTINLRKFNEASGVPSLSRNTVYSIKINTPTPKEQEAIQYVLTFCDSVISNQNGMLSSLKNQKQALMQQLLTGKRRVKVDAEVT